MQQALKRRKQFFYNKQLRNVVVYNRHESKKLERKRK